MVYISTATLVALASTLVSLTTAHYVPTWNLASFKEPDCNANATIGPPVTLAEGACHNWAASSRWHSIGPIWAMRESKDRASDPYKGKKEHNEPDPDLHEKFETGSCQLSTFSEKGCRGPFDQAFRGKFLNPAVEQWCMQIDDDVRSMKIDCKRKETGRW